VICEECGEVTPFDDERLETAVARVERSLSHRVSSHEVVIRGICPDCARKRPGR
jgi:Fur family ferric uptake transcriptional regulator